MKTETNAPQNQRDERQLEALIRLLTRYYIRLGLAPTPARRAAEMDFAPERNTGLTRAA